MRNLRRNSDEIMSDALEENEKGAAISAPENLCDSLNFNQGGEKMQKYAHYYSLREASQQSAAQFRI